MAKGLANLKDTLEPCAEQPFHRVLGRGVHEEPPVLTPVPIARLEGGQVRLRARGCDKQRRLHLGEPAHVEKAPDPRQQSSPNLQTRPCLRGKPFPARSARGRGCEPSRPRTRLRSRPLPFRRCPRRGGPPIRQPDAPRRPPSRPTAANVGRTPEPGPPGSRGLRRAARRRARSGRIGKDRDANRGRPPHG